jgi:predicted metal-binding protein
MRLSAWFVSASIVLLCTGCQYYGEYRVLKATADLQDERTELLKAYRLSLTKYRVDSPKAKEIGGPYTQSLREIEVKRQHGR